MSEYIFPSETLFPSPSLFTNEEEVTNLTQEGSQFPVPLTDEFTNILGEWINYSSISLAQEEQLRLQKHIDIRSFVPDKYAAQVTMFMMDRLTMFSMDNSELGLYSRDSVSPAKIIVKDNEGWTFGSVGPQSDRNNWNGIEVECLANQITTTQSVIMTQS